MKKTRKEITIELVLPDAVTDPANIELLHRFAFMACPGENDCHVEVFLEGDHVVYVITLVFDDTETSLDALMEVIDESLTRYPVPRGAWGVEVGV